MSDIESETPDGREDTTEVPKLVVDDSDFVDELAETDAGQYAAHDLNHDLVIGNLTARLDSLTHTSSELLNREHGVFVERDQIPALDVDMAGRPVLLLTQHPRLDAELKGLRSFIRQTDPIVVAEGEAAVTARKHVDHVHVVMLDSNANSLPARLLRSAAEVVVVAPSGAATTMETTLAQMSIRPRRFNTTLGLDDASIALLSAHEAGVIVRSGKDVDLIGLVAGAGGLMAGTFLAHLMAGSKLVGASVIGTITRRGGWWRWLVAVVAILLALAVGVAAGVGPLRNVDQLSRLKKLSIVDAPSTSSGPKAPVTSTPPTTDSGGASGDSVAAALGPAALKGSLAGASVVIVTLPGVTAALTKQVRALITGAGAQPTTVALSANALSDGDGQLIGSLTTQVYQQSQTSFDATTPPFQRLGQLLAAAVRTGPVPLSTTAVQAITAGTMATFAPGAAIAPTVPLRVIVLSPGTTTGTAYSQLLAGLQSQSSQLVVAQTGSGTSLPQGVPASSTAHAVAFVPTVDSSTGSVAAVAALAAKKPVDGAIVGASGISSLLTVG